MSAEVTRTVAASGAPVVTQSRPGSAAPPAERAAWGGKAEFILTCIGFAVGLGNVWRFPYLCYQNGGGAFLIPYIITLILVGIPMYLLEMALGQFSSLGCISMWKINFMFKGVGIAMVIIAVYIVLYYNVIVAWCMFYFFASMNSELPWATCNNWWNTEACVNSTANASESTFNGTIKTAADEYFYNGVLQISDSIDDAGGIVWQLALLLMLAWIIIFLVLLNGVGSLGKTSYFVSLFPYVLLTIILGQVGSLDGAREGIIFYLSPNWSRLGDFKVWSDAATQIFYSLGICMGSLIAMASYNQFNNNIIRDAIMIPIINCLTSIYSGFVVFSMLGFIAKSKNIPIEEVATEGPGLVFVAYPEGLLQLPAAPVWCTLFFFMMTILGFSSQFSSAEGVCATIMDEFAVLKKRPMLVRAVYCAFSFLLGLPMVTRSGFFWFKLMDEYTSGYTLLVMALLEIMATQWVYGFHRFRGDIELMIGKKPNGYWYACWVGIAPAFILFVFVTKCIGQKPLSFEDYIYPGWANTIAWLIVVFPNAVLVLWMVVDLFRKGGGKVCVKINTPERQWGPALPENRTGNYSPDDLKEPAIPMVEMGEKPGPSVPFAEAGPLPDKAGVFSVSDSTGRENPAFVADDAPASQEITTSPV